MSCSISAVITTYLRPDVLTEAVRSLCHQSLPFNQYEILIADTAAHPKTEAVVHHLQAEFPDHKLAWLPIPQNNAALARNIAFQQANSPLIAYLDDDAQASRNWLETGLHCFETIEALDCVGGPILPFYTTSRPEWYKDQYETRTWGEEPRWLSHGEVFSGSNMIWRRLVLDKINGFNPRLGPEKGSFRLGEDTSAFFRAWEDLSEPKFYYCPNLVVNHWVPAYKMNVSYLLRRSLVSGQVPIRLMESLSFSRRIKILIRSMGAACVYSLGAVSRRFRYREWQNWIIEEGRQVANKIGAACAAAGIWIDIHQK